MASYQLSEKNQILIALFAIVVVCAGKLFKDYLFRRGYVEGMMVTTTTNKQLRRNAAGGDNLIAELYLDSTLERELTSSQNIQLSWTGNAAAAAVDVTTSTNGSDYTATVVSGTTSATLTPSGSSSPITFTPSANIAAGSKIRITVKNVTIFPGSKIDSKLTFTVTPSNGESAVSREFKIFPALSASQTQFVSSSSATTTEIQAAINDINTRLSVGGITMPDTERTNLLKARSALVTLLASTYGTVKEAGQVFDSDALYEAQKTAIQFIQSEKERAAANANALKEDNSNKRRMAQINTYYTKNYEANTEVMKNIIFVSIALIVLAVLRNKDLVPESIGTLGVIFVLTLGGIVIGKQVFDIIRRNDHDFDKYDWNFNEDEMNRKQLLQQNSDPTNLLDMGLGMAPCYGPGCCDVGTSWDASIKKCIPGAGGRISGTAAWTNAAGGTLTTSLKVTNALLAGNTITMTLPSGLFTGTPALSGTGFTGTPSISAPFALTVGAAVAAGGVVPNIVITGLSVSPNAYSISKQLKVKTTSDINDVGINITGIPS
jgi:hypothetical protein